MYFTLSPFDNVKSKQGPGLEELTPAKGEKETTEQCALFARASAADGREWLHRRLSPSLSDEF